MNQEKELRIKGFDKDLKCRDTQFEIGKEYNTGAKQGELRLCSNTVYHYCKSLQQAHMFYNCGQNNRFCYIQVLGEEISDVEKYGSNHIKILRELTDAELRVAKGQINGNTGLFNSGNENSGNKNSGDKNNGDRNSGNENSGDRNGGYWNSGNWNSGNWNSGDWNSGNWNSGNWNSGNWNSGNWNSGNWNSGIFNKTNNSSGIFCNIEPPVSIFNIQTGLTMTAFLNSNYWAAIRSSGFNLVEREEFENVQENGIGGKLIEITYENACRNWWNNMTKDNREIVKTIPNFDIAVFCDITGIAKEDV